MDGLAILLARVHPVDRDILQLWADPRLTDLARRALYGYRYWPGVRRRWSVTREPDLDDTYVVRDGDLLAPCRGGNHEHCDVGIVAGVDRLSPMPSGEPFPIVRRACDTRVFGRVSLLAAL